MLHPLKGSLMFLKHSKFHTSKKIATCAKATQEKLVRRSPFSTSDIATAFHAIRVWNYACFQLRANPKDASTFEPDSDLKDVTRVATRKGRTGHYVVDHDPTMKDIMTNLQNIDGGLNEEQEALQTTTDTSKYLFFD